MAKDSPAGLPKVRTRGKAGEIILVAVSDADADNRGHAHLTDDVDKAVGIVASLVASGAKPESVSALRATEVPLAVSYEWVVQIGDKAAKRSRPRTTPSPGAKERRVLDRANEFLHEIMPGSPLQLRFDRIVWLGLWGASLLVLAILLVASLSGGNAREFVIGGQPSPAGSEVTAAPTSAPPGASPGVRASPGVSASAPLPSCLQGTVNNCGCQDFASQGEAQKFFNTYPPPVQQPVDPDGDGFVCEWLPRITPSPAR